MTKLSIQAICDKGPTRGNNEDMISVSGILLRDNQCDLPSVELDPEGSFFLLLSDGMGGHEHGERASEMLLQHLGDCFKQKIFTPENIEEQLREQGDHERYNGDEEAEEGFTGNLLSAPDRSRKIEQHDRDQGQQHKRIQGPRLSLPSDVTEE